MVGINDYNIYFRHGQNQDSNMEENQQNIKGGVVIAIKRIYNKNMAGRPISPAPPPGLVGGGPIN